MRYATSNDTIWYYIQYDYNMKLHEIIRYVDTIWYEMTQYDPINDMQYIKIC